MKKVFFLLLFVSSLAQGQRGFVSRVDPDAVTFFSISSVSSTYRYPLNQLTICMKEHGNWSPSWACYPFAGGSATPHTYNLFNTATFQLTFTGSWTHTSNGSTGASAFANTGITANSSFLSTSSGMMAFYSGTNTSGNYYDLGAAADGGVNQNLTIVSRFTNGLAYGVYGNAGYLCNVAVANSLGLFAINMQTATNEELWQNGVQIKTATEASTLPATTIYLGALHNAASGLSVLHSPRQFRFAIITTGRTSTQMTDLYNDVLHYETNLGRN